MIEQECGYWIKGKDLEKDTIDLELSTESRLTDCDGSDLGEEIQQDVSICVLDPGTI